MEPDLDLIRARILVRLNTVSIRRLAKEIGVHHATLANFVNGSSPQRPIRYKLKTWTLAQPGLEQIETVREALNVILETVPESIRPQAQQLFCGYLREGLEAAGIPVPEWVEARFPPSDGPSNAARPESP